MTDRLSVDNLNDKQLDDLVRELNGLRRFVHLVTEELDAWTDTVSPAVLRAALDALRPPTT